MPNNHAHVTSAPLKRTTKYATLKVRRGELSGHTERSWEL